MEQDTTTEIQRPAPILILVGSAVIYTVLCGPAAGRRDDTGIDPFWLAMPWLWVPGLILYGLFEGDYKNRNRRVFIYTVFCSLVAANTLIYSVPRFFSVEGVILSTLIETGPINLMIALVVEGVSRCGFKFLRLGPYARPNPVRKGTFVVATVVLALAVAFPSTYRAIEFNGIRERARAQAEWDWKSGEAVWFLRRDELQSTDMGSGTYRGLAVRPFLWGVSRGVYCNAYRETIARRLAEGRPMPEAKKIRCTEAELLGWIKEGRFKKVDSLPLKHGTTVIDLKGYQLMNSGKQRLGRPSKYLYQAVIPEKVDALVAITDQCVWVFDHRGELLQSMQVGFNGIGITEELLNESR